MSSLVTGMRFHSYDEFQTAFTDYKTQTCTDFSVKSSQTLEWMKNKSKRDLVKNAPAELRYYVVNFTCVHGGSYRKNKISNGVRNTSSMKMDCPALITLKLSGDGKYLVIDQMIDQHNHVVSCELFKCLPSQRKLDPKHQEEIARLLELKANKKLVQEKYSAITQKNITLRDLSNLAARAKSKKADFEEIVKNLQSTYKCTVRILTDENKNLKCIYVQDDVMKADFERYPEIIFADCTYKLTDIRAPIFIMMNENGNGESVIVAAGVFVSEEQGNYKWFLETFKEQNPASCLTCVVMTDKDANERSVFREVFPHVQLKICLFHTMQIFHREITPQKMGVSSSLINDIKDILLQLCYATTEEMYMEAYHKLYLVSPQSVMEYYDRNWHPIMNEWTCVSYYQGSTYLNKTNNRVENFNSALKSVVTQFSSLENFFKSFFSVIKSKRLELTASAANAFSKVTTEAFPSLDACRYYKYLTPYAYNLLKEQLIKASSVENEKIVFYQTTECTCQCSFRRSMKLPCKHIFANRFTKQLNLYEESLVSKRWTKSHYLSSFGLNICTTDTSTPNVKVDVVPEQRNLTTSQKFRKAQVMTNKIAMLMSESPFFQEQFSFLQRLYDSWANGKEPTDISPATDPESLSGVIPSLPEASPTSSGVQVPVQEPNEPTDISPATDPEPLSGVIPSLPEASPTSSGLQMPVILPSVVKVRGRPKGIRATAIGLPLKKRRKTESVPVPTPSKASHRPTIVKL